MIVASGCIFRSKMSTLSPLDGLAAELVELCGWSSPGEVACLHPLSTRQMINALSSAGRHAANAGIRARRRIHGAVIRALPAWRQARRGWEAGRPCLARSE